MTARARTALCLLALNLCACALLALPTGAASSQGRIVYAEGQRLMAVSALGGRPYPIAHIPSGAIDVSASADGRHFALLVNRPLPAGSRGSVRSFYRLDLGGGLHLLRQLRTRSQLQVAISPDGRLIAFCRASEIWTMRADGSGLRQVSQGPGVAFDPTFTPGGRALVFVRSVWRQGDGLVRQELGGGGETPIPGTAEARFPAVSPDGLIAFHRSAEGSVPERLVVMGADGSGRHTIARTDDPVYDSHPVFSPDGRKVAFLRLWERNGSSTSYRYSIHTAAIGGGDRRKVLGGLRSSAREPLRKSHPPLGPLWVPGPG